MVYCLGLEFCLSASFTHRMASKAQHEQASLGHYWCTAARKTLCVWKASRTKAPAIRTTLASVTSPLAQSWYNKAPCELPRKRV